MVKARNVRHMDLVWHPVYLKHERVFKIRRTKIEPDVIALQFLIGAYRVPLDERVFVLVEGLR
jgi:hypothetical protein